MSGGLRNRKGGAGATPSKLRGIKAASSSSESDAAAVVAPAEPAAAVEGDWLQRNEAIVHWIVLALAAFSRYYRLDRPPGVVFDETHFGRFTNQYSEQGGVGVVAVAAAPRGVVGAPARRGVQHQAACG